MRALAGNVKNSRATPRAAREHVGAIVEQQLRDIQIADLRGEVNGRELVERLQVHVGFRLDEREHNSKLPSQRRDAERCEVVVLRQCEHVHDKRTRHPAAAHTPG